MMGSVDPVLDFWNNLSSEQRSVMAQQMAQQQQQSYAQMDASKLQATQTYGFGWHDAQALYVFGGNDPQRAYKEIPNTQEELHKHLMGIREPLKPVSSKKKAALFIGLGVFLIGLLVVIKLIGVV